MMAGTDAEKTADGYDFKAKAEELVRTSGLVPQGIRFRLAVVVEKALREAAAENLEAVGRGLEGAPCYYPRASRKPVHHQDCVLEVLDSTARDIRDPVDPLTTKEVGDILDGLHTPGATRITKPKAEGEPKG